MATVNKAAGWRCGLQDKKAVDIPKTSNTTAPQEAGYIMEYEHGQIRNGTVAIVGKTCARRPPCPVISVCGGASVLEACVPRMLCKQLARAPDDQHFSSNQSGHIRILGRLNAPPHLLPSLSIACAPSQCHDRCEGLAQLPRLHGESAAPHSQRGNLGH